MKKLLLLLIIVLAFASCEKDTEKIKPIWDSTATILIRPAKGVKTRASVNGLTALEIVEQGVSLHTQSHYWDNKYSETPVIGARGFSESMKDFELPALKMLAIDVVSADGLYYRDLTHATDVYIINANLDTIAFIPDEVISTARPLIEAAFNSEDYDEVYRLFNEAFTFQPIE